MVNCSIVHVVNCSIVFRWVKNSHNIDFVMITNVPAYLFCKRGGTPKLSKARVSTSSMTMFAATDETGEHITVPKTCL